MGKERINELVVKKLTVLNSLTPDFAADQEFETVTATTAVETDVVQEHSSAAGVTIDGLLVKDKGFVIGAAGIGDMDGKELILDADADTSITADTDDQIDIKVSGADDFRITANTFTALSGSTIATDTIAEVTSATGVTIDGALIKDNTTSAGRQSQILTATGAITVGNHGVVQLNHASVIIAATLAAPQAGADLWIVDNSASGTAAHTVTLPAGVTFDGTNNTATLNAPGEALYLVALSATRWFIALNIGSVALSSV